MAVIATLPQVAFGVAVATQARDGLDRGAALALTALPTLLVADGIWTIIVSRNPDAPDAPTPSHGVRMRMRLQPTANGVSVSGIF